jgi:hypothetical protein
MELAMQIEIADGTLVVDAALIGSLLNIAPEDVPALMRTQAITSLCERGVDEHEGEYRLSFFYQNRRARISVDAAGTVLRRSAIDFGEMALPRQLHRAGT